MPVLATVPLFNIVKLTEVLNAFVMIESSLQSVEFGRACLLILSDKMSLRKTQLTVTIINREL